MPIIAYLTSVYPRASDSFIRAEIAALRAPEGGGFTVHTFSIRPPAPDQLVSDEIKTEHANTTYLLRSPFSLLAPCFLLLASLLLRPAATLRAARLALRLRWPGLRGSLLPLAYLLEAAALARHLRRQKISHLHNHIGENSAAVALLAATLANIPYSLTIHGPYEFDHPHALHLDLKISHAAFTAAISNYTRAQLYRWSHPTDWPRIHLIHCGLTPEFLNHPPTPLPPLSPATTVAGTSADSTKLSDPSSLSSINDQKSDNKNSLPPGAQLPITNDQLQSPFRLLCVGRLCPEKGQLLLLQSLAQLIHSPNPQSPISNFKSQISNSPLPNSLNPSIPQSPTPHLTFIGDGPSRPLLQSQIQQLNLTNHVTLTGWLPAAEVRCHLLASHALVLPSFAEGLPVVLMEALALHRPVLSTATNGIPELVIPHRTGFLVPPGSPEALTAALRTLLTTPREELETLAAAGAARVAQNHNAATEAAKLAALFLTSIASHSPF